MSCLTRMKTAAADTCFVALTLVLLVAETVLTTLGIILGTVLLATGVDGEVLFSQMDNLSRHYLAAQAAARAAFDLAAIGLFTGLLTLVLLLRLPGLAARLRAELSKEIDHD